MATCLRTDSLTHTHTHTHTHILGLLYLRGPELYTILPRTTLSTLLRMSRNVLFSRTICQYAIHRHCCAILLLVNVYFALTPHRIREDLLRGLQRSAVNILCRWFLLVHLLHTFLMTGLRGPHIFLVVPSHNRPYVNYCIHCTEPQII